MTARLLPCVAIIKNRTPRWQSLHYTRQRSTSTSRRLRVDLPLSIGPLVFRSGMSGQSSMALIILARRAHSPKRGAKFLAIRRRRLFLQFSPTKICGASVKHWRRSLIPSFYLRFAANAQLPRKCWQRLWRTLLGHSRTLSLHRSPTRLSRGVSGRTQFSSPAHFTSLAKFLRICAVNPVHLKNVRNDAGEQAGLGSARVSRAGERVLAIASFCRATQPLKVSS